MKTKISILGLILIGISSLTSAATIYVDAAATGANNGTSWADAYTTIQAAVDSAAFTATSDATILVADGVYGEMVTLASDNGGVDGAPNQIKANNPGMVEINGGGVRANGIKIAGASYVVLDGLVIRDATGSGIQLETAANCALSNLMVTASATGITVKNSPWLNVGHSSFSGNTGNGLLMERSNDCRFDYVDINRNNNGIGGSESATNLRTRFTHCVIARNTYDGFAVPMNVFKDSVWDHCSLVANRRYAFSWNHNNNNIRVTNSIVAYNGLSVATGNSDNFRIGGSLA